MEDMEGSLGRDPSAVALLERVVADEERRASRNASANMSQALPPGGTPQERSKLDALARIFSWRFGNCVTGSCAKPNPVGTKLIVPDAARPQGIFGVPLRQSITYANVAISLVDEDGKSYIYGYVPIVVAKCGVFLKERGAYSTIYFFSPIPRCGLRVSFSWCVELTKLGSDRGRGDFPSQRV